MKKINSHSRFILISTTLLQCLFVSVVQAATYEIPSDIGVNGTPFSDCSGSAPNISCTRNLQFNNDDTLILTTDIIINLNNKNLTLSDRVTINQSNSYSLSIENINNVTSNNNVTLNANISANNDINFGNDTVIKGNISADGDIKFSNSTTITGNISSEESITFADRTNIVGNVSASDAITFGNETVFVGNMSGDSTVKFGDRTDFEGSLTATGSITFSHDVTIEGDIVSGDDLNFGERPDITGSITAVNDITFTNPSNATGEIACSADDGNYPDAPPCATPPTINLASPVLEYRFDETAWNGATDEVIDSSASLAHGTTNARISNVGVMCNAASFDGIDQIITSPGLSALQTTSTLSFWIKTSDGYRGNLNPQNAPAVTGTNIDTDDDIIFWGAIDNRGKISMSKGDTRAGNSIKDKNINDNNYHHVAMTWDSTTGAVRVYIDGSLDHNYVTETGDVSQTFNSIGIVEDSSGSLVYLEGLIDEFLVFDEALSTAEIAEIYSLQSNNQNLDGSTRSCAPPKPAICFTDQFDRTDLGENWAVSNRSGSFGDPRIVNGRLRINNNTANASTAATLFRLFPSIGNKIVIEFDYYAYDAPATGGDGIALVFSDASIAPQPGGYGGSLGYAPKNTTSGFAGGWMGVGFDEYGNFLNKNDGGKTGGFTSPIRETITIRGSGSGTTGYRYITSNGQVPTTGTPTAPTSLSPPVETETGHRYRVIINHENGTQAWVTIERNTGSGYEEIISAFDILAQTGQATIPSEMYLTITGSTGGARNTHEIDNLEVCANTIDPAYFIDHYELDRDYDQGLTCEPLNISARACLDESCNTQISEPVTTTFAPTSGWTSSNIKTNYNSGESFLFQQTTVGDYTLDILDSSPSLKPLATDPVKCFVSGAEQSDCKVEFVDAAYRFFTSTSSSSTPNYSMTAGQFLNNLEMRAIERNETTGECQSFLTSGTSVSSHIGTICSDPTSCAIGEQVSWQQNTSTLIANPENLIGGESSTTTGIDFGGNSTAQFNLMAPDIGLQVLTITSPDYPDVDGLPSGKSITGSVNLNVSPASLQITTVTNANGDSNDGTAAFAKSGENFTTQLQALDINNNPVASFGRVTGLYDIEWSNSSLAGPSGGVEGNIVGDSVGTSSANQWQGTNINGTLDGITFMSGNGIHYSEVGNVNLMANITDFMGFGTSLTSNTVNTGRFTPAYLQVSQVDPSNAIWGDHDEVYQGQPNTISGLVYDLIAYDLNGAVLYNYVDDYVNFGMKTNGLEKDSSQSLTGGALNSSLNWTLSNDSDFDGLIRLTADPSDLTWYRNTTSTSGPTSADTLQTIANFQLNADTFTDQDGICIKTSDSGNCLDSTADIVDRSLYYGRLALPEQVNATDQTAYVPVTLEYLSGFVGTEPIFSVQTTESFIDRTILAGLDYTAGLCTLTGCPGTGTSTANLADDTLTNQSGSGTTLSRGQGLFTINSPTSLQGMLAVASEIPDWLTWYWQGDLDDNGDLDPSDLVASSTLLLFGNYQGRAPILFTRPGFR